MIVDFIMPDEPLTLIKAMLDVLTANYDTIVKDIRESENQKLNK